MSESHGPGGRPRPLRRLLLAFVSLHSFGSVLVLILLTYALSVGLTATWARSLVLMVQIATVLARSARRGSSARGACGCERRVALSAVIAGLNLVGVDEVRLAGLMFTVSALLYLIAPMSILRSLVSQPDVDQETVLGAVAAYLFVGMFFAFSYQAMAEIGSSVFFEGGGSDTTVAQSLFFSFTTLTTTGYGNLVPAGNPGQSFAVIEMLIGQLFLVTAVAKVINAWQPARWKAATKPSPEKVASAEPPEGPQRRG